MAAPGTAADRRAHFRPDAVGSRFGGTAARLKSGRWLIALVMLLTVSAAFLGVRSVGTTYTARATLSAASAQAPEHSRMSTPNEDAALGATYANYFNTPAFQDYVRTKVDVPADVTSFGARVEGTDPLLYVVATAGSPETARTAVGELAAAFVDEVQQLVAGQRAQRTAVMQESLRAEWGDGIARGDPAAADASLRVQARVDAMNSDSRGLLSLVTPDAGVITNAPGEVRDLLLALIGGLLLGCAVVVVRARVSRRMTTAQDVQDKTGLPVLAVGPGPAAPWTSPIELPDGIGSGRSTLAITPVTGGAAGPVADAIARRCAVRGDRVVIVRANLRGGDPDGNGGTGARPGVADHLRSREPIDVDDLITEDGGVRVLGAGTPGGDPFVFFDRERFARLVDEVAAEADLVIIESPDVAGHPEALVANGLADHTLVVLERDRTSADDAVEAVRGLEQAGAHVRGAVVAGASGPRVRIPRTAGGRMRSLLGTAAVLGAAGALVVAAPSAPGGAGGLALLGAVGLGAVYLGLRDPRWAYVFLLAGLFLRLGLPKVLPVDAFLLAFAGFVVSSVIWMAADRERRPVFGAVELAMGLYLLWNVVSAVLPHEYDAAYPLTGDTISLYRYVLIGTVIPFTAYLVSRTLFVGAAAVRNLLRVILAFSAYSAWVSILQFTGPTSLIWPRYIVDSPNWPGRANGVFNQSSVNGLVLVVGFLVALVLAAEKGVARWLRSLYVIIAIGCSAGVYLTHTRAIYLAFAVVIVLGTIFARGWRSWFGTTAAVLTVGVALNWSTFTSADRSAGGVASTNEIYDRLNAAATSIWAFWEKPWFGWGIGRFVSVNSFHHKQWAPDSPWIRGLGIASHFNELGILVELGIVGLLLWLAVLALLVRRLVARFRTVPEDDIAGRPLVLTAMLAFVSLIILGCFTDLRLFDYPTAMVFGLIGTAIGAGNRRGVAGEYVKTGSVGVACRVSAA